MDKNIPNKSMQAGSIKTKNQYHFAGGTEYEPITIKAESLEQATEEYEKIKKPINK